MALLDDLDPRQFVNTSSSLDDLDPRQFVGEKEDSLLGLTWHGLKEGTKDVARSTLGALRGNFESQSERDAREGADIANMFGVDPSLMQDKSSASLGKVISNTIQSDTLKEDNNFQHPNGLKGYYYDVVRQAPQIAGQIGATALGGPVGGVAFMGSQIAGSDYNQLREEGVSPERALTAGIADAAMQAPLEQFSLGKFAKVFKGIKNPQTSKELLKKFIDAGGTELLTEWAQQYPQDAAQLWAKTEGVSNEDRVKAYIDHIGETTKAGLYSGLVTLPFSVLGTGAGMIGRRRANGSDALSSSSSLDNLDPESFVDNDSPSRNNFSNQDPYQAMAQQVSAKTGIPANLIYGQLYHESGGFSSQLARENNNFAGLTQSTPNGEDNKQPDGDNYYRKFDNPDDFANAYADYLMKYKEDGILNAKTPEEYATALKNGGYYTDSVENYIAGIKAGMDNYSGSSGGKSNNINLSREQQQQIRDFAQERVDQSNDIGEINFIGDNLKRDMPGLIEIGQKYNLLPQQEEKPQQAAITQEQIKNLPKLEQDQQSEIIQRLPSEQLWDLAIQYDTPKHAGIQKTLLNELAYREQGPNINKAQTALNNARNGLINTPSTNIRPFVEPARAEQGRNLVSALDAVNANKFDTANQQAYWQFMQRQSDEANALQAQKDAIASEVLMSPTDRMEVGATLPEKTSLPGQGVVLGEQQQPRADTVLPSQQANDAGIQVINEIKEKPAVLPTTDQVMLQRQLMQAIHRDKNFVKAAELADALNMPEKANLYRQLASPQAVSNNIQESTNNLTVGAEPGMQKLFAGKIKFSQEKASIGQRHGDLRRKGYNRSQIIDTLVDEYEGPGYDPNSHLPGFAQHPDLTPQRIETLRKDVAKIINTKVTPDTLEKQLYQRYNEGKGIQQNVNSDLTSIVDKLAFLKGVMWHVREKIVELSGTNVDAGQGQTGEFLRSPYARFLMGSRSGRKERGIRNEPKYSSEPDKRGISKELTSGITLPDHVVEQSLGIRFFPKEKLNTSEQAISELGNQMGVPVRFFIGRRGFHGFYIDGITHINRNGNRGIEWAFWHESLHWVKQQDARLYQDIVDAVQSGEKITDDQINQHRIAIGKDSMSDADVIEEMFGDKMADVALRQKWFEQLYGQNRNLFDKFVDWLKQTIAKIKDMAAEHNSLLTEQQAKDMEKGLRNVLLMLKDSTGRRVITDRTQFPYKQLPAESVQFSSGNRQESFSRQLDDWAAGKLNPRQTIIIGKTPDILIKIGAKQLPIEISQKTVAKIVNLEGERGGKHGLSVELLKQLPDQLSDPIMIFRSATQPNSIVVLTELSDAQNRRIVSAVRLEVVHNHNLVNAIASVYGRNNDAEFIKREISAGRLLYENKEKSRLLVPGREATIASGSNSTNDSINSILQQDEKDVKNSNIKFSADSESVKNSVRRATTNLAQNLGFKPAENVNMIEKPADTDPKFIGGTFNSVNVIANKHPELKPFFMLADKSVEIQEKLRQHFQHRSQKVEQTLGNTGIISRHSKEYKENKKNLFQIRIDSDNNEKNFTTQELRDLGYNGQVIKAYHMICAAYQHAWKLSNEIRQGIETKSENLTAAKLEKLRQNRFVEILSEKHTGEDNYLVTWKQPKLFEQVVTMTKRELEELRTDPNVQITKEKPLSINGHALPQSQGVIHGDGFYEVEYRAQTPPITNRAGYIPHFFHEWFIMHKDEDGQTKMLYSARTPKEALSKANEYAKQLVSGEIVVKPKQFKFPGADVNAAVMGDMDYFRLANKVSDDLEISLDDARQFLDSKVHMKNRHRFVGNFLQRKGANGWEQDLDWVDRHYFNMVSRYVAMDPFKSKATSMFERLFGQWGLDHDGLAGDVKDYINDVSGVPSDWEKKLNSLINDTKWLSQFLGSYLGDRPAAQIAGGINNAVAVLKLGFYNPASAIIQTTQFLNVASAMDSFSYASEGLRRGIEPGMKEKMILYRAGVDANLSMESGAGYSKAGQAKKWFQSTTVMFRYMDILMRRAAVLGAYQKAIDEGKSRGEALEYAKKINRKANFEYGVQDAPNLFRRSGAVGQPFLQFKKYPIKQLEFMADLFLHGNLSQNAKFWVPYLLLSGIWGFPFVNLLKIFASWFGWEWEKEIKSALMDWAGEDKTKQVMAKTAMYGIMSNAGVDISRRTGLGDVMPTDTKDLFGPVAGTIYQTGVEMSRGNWYEAVKAVSPGVGNALVALAGETRGDRGRVKTKYETYFDQMVKGMGFTPTDEAVERDNASVIKYMEQNRRNDEEKAIDAYIHAYKDKDESAKQKAIVKLKELRITPKRVNDEMARKDKTNLERTIENLPKKQQQQYRKIVNFE